MTEDRQLLATASVPRSRKYFAEMYRLLMRQRRFRQWFLWGALALLFAWALWIYSATSNNMILVLLAICGLSVFGIPAAYRWKWLHDRMADLQADHSELEFRFYDDRIFVSTESSAGEIDWTGMYKAVQEAEGLLIYPRRGAAFYIPTNCINPRSAIGTILLKVNRDVKS